MREFMACQGQIVLANYLNGLNVRKGRNGIDVEMEIELLKCLKRSLSNRVGYLILLERGQANFGRLEHLMRSRSRKSWRASRLP